MTTLRSLHEAGFFYDHIIATGGIGSGMFLLLEGEHTLGRNESRMAALKPCKDFCKQHIILHYLAVLLGGEGRFQTYPIGKIGDDAPGKDCYARMKDVGMNTTGLTIEDGKPSLFSVCFQYPDGSGGNITTAGSASSSVTTEDINQFFNSQHISVGHEVILAVPEVPVSARIRLLEYGKTRGSFNVASILSSEVDDFRRNEGFLLCDLLAVNIDEARHISGTGNDSEVIAIVDACIETLSKINPSLTVLITDGANGSYAFHQGALFFTPAMKVHAISTAGAGDAFISGTIAGLACGLPLTKGKSDKIFAETAISSAVEMGTLLASFAVTSADTIHLDANASSLYRFSKNEHITFDKQFAKVFASVS